LSLELAPINFGSLI